MKRKIIGLIGLLIITAFIGCATSMTPAQLSSELPKMTNSIFLTRADLQKGIDSGGCQYLMQGRRYTAPIGLTVKDDLRNGAIGIDDWVRLDGGNAYSLVNYEWIQVDEGGSTQLTLEFDTILCN